jgi:transposase
MYSKDQHALVLKKVKTMLLDFKMPNVQVAKHFKVSRETSKKMVKKSG